MTARLLGFLSVACLMAASAVRADAQVGALLSPGPLTRPHAQLEGLSNCQRCHERGNRVTAAKCLVCHEPVAARVARKIGVHRNVTGDCVSCHAEHGGVDAQLRPFDQKAFDHAGVTGFPLTGKHAPLAQQCAACHKSRSFLTLGASCSSCHTDVHKGALGSACTNCHSTQTAFKDLGGTFDHSKTAFQLAGAHRTVACTGCHAGKTFKVARFSSCADCHRDPHRQTFGAACAACHTSDAWRTRKVDHTRTKFPLAGRHAAVDCAACHKQPALRAKPASATCASCHADVHRGAFRQDCKACHSESGFTKAPFDHVQTRFALTGKHSGLACARCHKTVAFSGLQTGCASCHADVHQSALGTACETCHTSSTFRVSSYAHARVSEFFGGQHTTVACEKCHVPQPPAVRPARTGAAVLNVTFKNLPTACVACHRDVHLGQVGTSCENCHSVQAAKFAVARFDHAATAFPLTGRHQTTACAQCHKTETGTFPAGPGTAIRFKGAPRDCRGCHADAHLGQLIVACETCHKTDSFKVPAYVHRGKTAAAFFVGRHVRATCQACHKPVAAQFPSGRGTAIRFKTDNRCIACHADVHRGALGPNCSTCHKP